MKKMLIIYNPRSGSTMSRKDTKDFVATFSKYDFEVTVLKTKCKSHAKQIAKVNKNDYDVIVAVGGDGTFNEVINGVMPDYSKPIVYFPNGTTNDTAKTLNISNDVEEIAKLIQQSSYNSIDVGKMNSRYFFCTVSFGFGSNASLKTKQSLKNLLGHFAYILSGITNVGDIKSTNMTITCDDEVFQGEYVFGAVVNTISVGGIFRVDEKTFKLNDGEFEVVLVPKIRSVLEVPKLLSLLKKQKFDNRHIILKKCKNISFKTDKSIPWLIDGENGGNRKSVSISVIHHGISVYSPENKYYI